MVAGIVSGIDSQLLRTAAAKTSPKAETRAIEIREGDRVDEAALTALIRAAVALNLEGKSKPKPRRARSKRAD